MNAESALVFPKQAERPRLNQYEHYGRIYFGEHYDAFAIKGDKDFTERYKRLRYVVANFGGLMSRVLADMLFGETVKIDYQDAKLNQKWSDGFFEENQLLSQLYESALVNSRLGDDVFKLRIGQRNPKVTDSKVSVIAEEITPAIYFPVLDEQNTRNTPESDVLAMQFKENGKCYLHKEIHVPGTIYHEIYEYDPKQQKIIQQLSADAFGYPDEEETGVKRSLVFHVPNVRDGSGFWGTSDYRDLDTLFYALNNRITKIDNVLDKHTDPILAVPPGVIDEEGKVKKEALGMFEVDNENTGFVKPEYIVWNANLESAFKEVDKLMEMLLLMSEISPASVGMDQGGNAAQSGRALKFMLLATIRKMKRKQRYYDQFMKDMLETAIELGAHHNIEMGGVKAGTPERPSIKWPDGVINDEVEKTDISIKRVEAGLSSRADEIADLDNISPEDAKKKVAEIDKESGPNLEELLKKTNAKPGQTVPIPGTLPAKGSNAAPTEPPSAPSMVNAGNTAQPKG